jgi:predicted ferric reductase
MKAVERAIFWMVVYLALVFAPLLLLLIGPVPHGSGFWVDLSIVLGYAAMSMMGVQFVLTARFRRASAPFGIDIIYYFHRYVGIIALALIVGHALILVVAVPALTRPPDLLAVPWQAYGAVMATVLMGALIVTSIWRKQLRINYERWRLWHGILAVVALLLAVAHIEGVGYYIQLPWKRALWTVITLSWLLLITYVRVVKPWNLVRRPFKVVGVRPERGNTWTLTLQPDGHAGIRFQPGQFAWLTVRNSPFSLKEHPFSFSSSAEMPQQLEFTIKELGDFTRTIKTIAAGEVAYVDGPFGVFSIDGFPEAPGFVFLAGGVGIAPVMSMLRTMADRNETRPSLLFYGNKRWDDVIFREEIEELSSRLDLQVTHILEMPPLDWQGETGVLTEQLLRRRLPSQLSEFEYFICGPQPMIRVAERALHALGVPLGRVHTELFNLV